MHSLIAYAIEVKAFEISKKTKPERLGDSTKRVRIGIDDPNNNTPSLCLFNGTVGVVFPLCLPNIMSARKIEVLLAPPHSFPVLTTITTFPTTVLQTRNYPPSPSFPSYQGSTTVTRSLLRDVMCLIGWTRRKV